MLAGAKFMEISSPTLHSCPNVEFKAKLCIGGTWPLKGDVEFYNWGLRPNLH
jgi:hypothetical protein